MGRFAEILGCKVGSFPVTYLGLPLCGGQANKVVWNPVVEKEWKENYLLVKQTICLWEEE